MTDQIKKTILGIFLFVFILIFISQTSAEVTVTYPTGSILLSPDNQFQIIEFENQNLSETPTVSLTLSSAISDYLQLSSSSVVVPSHASVTLSIKSGVSNISKSGTLNYQYGTNSGSIPVYLYVPAEENPIDPNACRLNPTLVTYTQTVSRDVEFELPKITFNPKNCDGEFSITSPYVSGGITTTEGQKPIYIKSSSSKEIILGVNTKGLSSAPYKSTLTLSAFDQTFTDVSTINIIVTGGTNPDTDFDVNNLPTCSITSNILNLNSTYSLVCTGIVPGVSIYPVIDNDYLKGIGPGDEMTSTNFVWEFQPKKMGNTFIVAEFRYLDLPVGEPFSQELKIQSTGSQTQGTDLEFHFSPTLQEAVEGEQIIVQLIDNKTGSLVESPEIYLNSIQLSSINSSAKSFPLNLQVNTNYELRGVAPGYNNIIKAISINPQFIEIIINPAVGDTSTMFNVSTDVKNATLKINGMTVDNPFYGTLSPGENILEASLSGYQTKTLNFTVKDYIRVIDGGFNFKKGEQQNLTLNREVTSWTVYYQKKLDSVEREILLTGTGSSVIFTPKKSGVYYIEADGFSVATYQSEGFSFSEKWWIFPIWGWIIIIVLGLGIIIFVIYLKGESSPSGPAVSEGGWEV